MAGDIDIMSAIRQIAAERKIEVDEILDAVRDAIKTIFVNEKKVDKDFLQVEFEPEKGHIAVYLRKDVVDEVFDPESEILESDAKKIKKSLKIGDHILINVTPQGDFGRIAAQTARQVILQKLRESEKEAIMRQFVNKVGTIITVSVQKVAKEGDVICEVSRAKALMPKEERVATEFYKLGSNIKVLLKAIEEDIRGKYMLVSRSDPDFLRELFKLEVPEIESGTVEIVSIAREAGSRSKVAVRSTAEGVDPIGACVGQKGVRINSVSNELKNGIHEEKVDIILWDDSIENFLMNSIRPAESLNVVANKKTKEALIVVPDDQFSLAIGREGQNARLSAKLTGWKIDILGETEFKARQEAEIVVEEKPKKPAKKKAKKDE